MRADRDPCSRARATVPRITVGSPAWKPHATFAEEMQVMSLVDARSCNRDLSPHPAATSRRRQAEKPTGGAHLPAVYVARLWLDSPEVSVATCLYRSNINTTVRKIMTTR
jgi:hypothetical protein